MTVHNPRPAELARSPVLFLAFGFGAGLAPQGPGTWGSLLALPLAALLLPFPAWFFAATVLITLIGIPICGQAAKKMGVHDHGGIVWDEIAGQMIACIPLFVLPPSINLISGLGMAFVLFRMFDIAKPWPIRYVDKHVHGGLGIMLDDVLAGFAAAGVLLIFLRMIG